MARIFNLDLNQIPTYQYFLIPEKVVISVSYLKNCQNCGILNISVLWMFPKNYSVAFPIVEWQYAIIY